MGLGSGCGIGEYRKIYLSADLTGADLAYFRQAAEEKPSNRVEGFLGGFPLLFLPVVLLRSHDVTVTRKAAQLESFHVEDFSGFLLATATSREIANFDSEGRSLSYESRSVFLFGLISLSSGHRALVGQPVHARTGSFSLFWGLLGRESGPYQSNWQVCWIPIHADSSAPP